MKKIRNLLLKFILLSLPLASFTNWVNVQVPNQNWDGDVNIDWPTTVQWEEKHIFVLIQRVNEYLRFSIAAICFGILVYAWVKLMSKNESEEESKKTWKLLSWALIWIVIAIVSYAVVRLIVNLI